MENIDKTTRARMIVEGVLALDSKFGQVDAPRSIHATKPGRLISDDPRWKARVSPSYEQDAAGESWDLFELFIYGQQRLTVVVKGSETVPRFYIPGKWEQIFLFFDPNDTVPLLPN